MDSSVNLLFAVNVLSIALQVDTSNFEDIEMLSDSDDTQGKTNTTTVDSTDKTHAPIITDMEREAQEPIEVDKSLEIELGLITTPLDSPLHLENRMLSAAYYLQCAPSEDACKH